MRKLSRKLRSGLRYSDFVKRFLYPGVQKLKGIKVLQCLAELEESQWLSNKEIKELQFKKLQKILNHAYEKIPYYNSLFKECDIHPSDIKSWDDFLRVPVLTKKELRTNLKTLCLPKKPGRIYIGYTSGSTGMPLTIYYDWIFEGWHTANCWRARRWHSIDIGDKEVAIWGRPVESQFERIFGRIKSRLRNVMIFSAFELSERKLPSVWKRIKRFRPKFLYGYPSALFHLANYVKKIEGSALDLGIEVAMTTAETLYSHYRKTLKEVFGCGVFNEYGSSELGAFAFECPQGSMHISDEIVLVEFIKEGKPVKFGEEGEILLTGLVNEFMPLIRYKVGDVGRPTNKLCGCGRGLSTMDITVGKIGETILTSKGRCSHSEIFTYINKGLLERKLHGIEHFRVIQKKVDNFAVEIVTGKEDVKTSKKFFEEQMRVYLGNQISINFKEVPIISRDKDGKLRYFLSEVG